MQTNGKEQLAQSLRPILFTVLDPHGLVFSRRKTCK